VASKYQYSGFNFPLTCMHQAAAAAALHKR